MNPWFGNIAYLLAFVISVAIRVPHDKISQSTKVTESRKGALEKALLAGMMLGLVLLPVLSFTPALAFAAYPLHPAAFAAGLVCALLSLWTFHRSHADLGRNWSVSLEIREGHRLVTEGIYRRIRHPMYTSIYLAALAQALLLPNWVAGPATLVAFTLMFASRLGTEERMMLDRFGAEYEAYRARSKRLIPGVW